MPWAVSGASGDPTASSKTLSNALGALSTLGKLEMRNDPALTKRVIEEFTKKGETPPDFVGSIELKDKSGRPRGDVLFLYSKNSPGTRI